MGSLKFGIYVISDQSNGNHHIGYFNITDDNSIESTLKSTIDDIKKIAVMNNLFDDNFNYYKFLLSYHTLGEIYEESLLLKSGMYSIAMVDTIKYSNKKINDISDVRRDFNEKLRILSNNYNNCGYPKSPDYYHKLFKSLIEKCKLNDKHVREKKISRKIVENIYYNDDLLISLFDQFDHVDTL